MSYLSPTALAVIGAYQRIGKTWARVTEIAEVTGLPAREIGEAVRELVRECDDVRAEPIAIGYQITPDDRDAAVIIGGEPRHIVRML